MVNSNLYLCFHQNLKRCMDHLVSNKIHLGRSRKWCWSSRPLWIGYGSHGWSWHSWIEHGHGEFTNTFIIDVVLEGCYHFIMLVLLTIGVINAPRPWSSVESSNLLKVIQFLTLSLNWAVVLLKYKTSVQMLVMPRKFMRNGTKTHKISLKKWFIKLHNFHVVMDWYIPCSSIILRLETSNILLLIFLYVHCWFHIVFPFPLKLRDLFFIYFTLVP